MMYQHLGFFNIYRNNTKKKRFNEFVNESKNMLTLEF